MLYLCKQATKKVKQKKTRIFNSMVMVAQQNKASQRLFIVAWQLFPTLQREAVQGEDTALIQSVSDNKQG